MPPLEKNRADFCRNLASGKTGENAVFGRFNVCWLSKVALLECVSGRFGVQRDRFWRPKVAPLASNEASVAM